MRDSLGYRAKIGVLVPATNTIVEPEMALLQPKGVTNHISRMSRVKRPADDLEKYKKFLGSSVDMEVAIDVLVACEPSIIVHGHSVDSLAKGLLGADQMKSSMEKMSGDIPVMLPSHAILRALELLGRPKKISILTPWMPPADQACEAFFREAGYNVSAIKGLQHLTPLDIATASPGLLNDAVDELNTKDTECIIKVGTNSAMAHLVEEMESRIGKPVLTVNVITYWAGLRSIGINDKINGYGQLVSTH